MPPKHNNNRSRYGDNNNNKNNNNNDNDNNNNNNNNNNRNKRNNNSRPSSGAANQWSASSGGNALEWLGSRVNAPKSKGALEYLKQQGRQGQGQETQKAQTTPPVPPAAVEPVSNNNADTGINEGVNILSHIAKKFPDKVKSDGPAAVDTAPSSGAAAQQQPPQYRGGKNRGNRNRASPQQQPAQPITIPTPLSKMSPEQQEGVHQRREDTRRRRQEMALPTDPVERELWIAQRHSAEQLMATLTAQYAQQEMIRVEDVQTEKLNIPEILKAIEEHDVTFVCTDTGSGKSTGIPKALLELSPHTRVVSTQPRRTATIAIATRVAQLRQSRVGQDVGYWIRGAKCGDDQTRLWYMTSYTLLLNLLNSPQNPPYTHIVLDEFHERQPDIEVIAALLKLLLQSKKGSFKLIIMSATLKTGDWEEYFEGLSVVKYAQAEPDHPIHDYFMEDVATLVGAMYEPPMGFNANFVDHHVLILSLEMAQRLILFINNGCNKQHSILVFVPGRAQVEQLQSWLQHNAPYTEPIPWHSAVELHVIEKAFKDKFPNRQKVYIATDIAECSITLPDVVFVIDTALVKRPQITKSSPATIMYPPLTQQWISQNSISQRRGRVGRVQQGFYFCLMSRRHIVELPEDSVAPIENSRIDELSLHVLQLVSNPVAIYGLCHSQPLIETISYAMNSLQQLGCIIPKEDPMAKREGVEEVYSNAAWSNLIMNEAQAEIGPQTEIPEYVCTFIGRLLQLIPVSAQQGMLVFYGFLTGLESLMIVTAAVTSSISPYTVTPKEDNHRNRNRRRDKAGDLTKAMERTEEVMKKMARGLSSDVVAVVGAVLQFRVKVAEADGVMDTPELRAWCVENQLSFERMVAILELESHIKYELSSFVPFRDVDEAAALQTQFEKLAPVLLVMINAAFASQALEVTSEGNVYLKATEGATGVFTNLNAVPDLHTPSCLRWEKDNIVVPISISLHYTRMIVGFATATRAREQFWISTLLFAYRIGYEDKGDDYHFQVTFSGKSRYVKVDSASAKKILEFRENCSDVCAMLRLRYSNKDMLEEDFTASVLEPKGYAPFLTTQRCALRGLIPLFGEAAGVRVEELEEAEKPNNTMLFSFAIKGDEDE